MSQVCSHLHARAVQQVNMFLSKCNRSFAFLSLSLHDNFCTVSGITQRYESRLLVRLQQNITHHPLQTILRYSLALEALEHILLAGCAGCAKFMFRKALKPTFLLKYTSNAIQEQEFIVYCTQTQRDATIPQGKETKILCTLQDQIISIVL